MSATPMTAAATQGAASAGQGNLPYLPERAPLAMPVQDLHRRPEPQQTSRPSSPAAMFLRRLLVIGGAVLLTVFGVWQMSEVLGRGKPTTLEILLLVLFALLFAWIALAFCSALIGFFCVLAGGERRLGIDHRAPLPALQGRTALLMPCYNENPERVMAGLEAIWLSLSTAGQAAHFDTFILSDTTDPDVWVAEEAAFLLLRQRLSAEARIFYRRRAKNTERKAGNIAEWVQHFGGAYPQMLVLDADSLMQGGAIIRLAAAMESHPDVGLIQSLPLIVNGSTLFARMQQFAGRVYGPLIAQGIAWWHGAEGNYWGHNAVIRTTAFAASAGLPHLHGPAPFGGHILSHDFVEAALLRRAGWAVHMVPALPGSYEESPPSLPDLALRDRRWCQGNLQHAAVLPTRGLAFTSRMHLLTGIGSYITAPLWLLFLILGALVSLQARFIRPDYFPNGPSLFPVWPVVDPVRAMWVFIGTMSLLLLPKLLAWLALLVRRETRWGCGGVIRSFLSLLLESVLAGLLAPVTMLSQTGNVIAILRGKDSGWVAQRRDDGTLAFGAVARLYWRHTLFGLLFGAAAYLVSPFLALWMSPVILGLALAIPLVALTSRRGAGLALRRLGLLLIPEERNPPSVLEQAALALPAYHDLLAAAPAEAVAHLAASAALLAAHQAMLPPPRRRGAPIDTALLVGMVKAREAERLEDALAGLSRAEKAAVLGDAEGTLQLIELTKNS